MARRVQKKRSKGRRNAILIVIGLAALVVAAVVVTRHHQGQVREREYMAKVDQLRLAMNRQINSRYDNDRWLTVNTAPATDAELDEAIDFYAHLDHRIEALIRTYHDASPFADSIARRFPNFHATVYTPYGSARLFRSKERPDSATIASAAGGFEICFIPRDLIDGHPSTLYYRSEWRALMFGLVDWPDKVLAPLLYHELGHAYNHLERHLPSAVAQPGTDPYDSEETDMHDLEMAVQNRVTDSAYYQLLDRILDRNPRATHYVEVVLDIRREDLQELDRMFGCQRAGPTVLGPLYAQFIYSVGARHLDRHIPGGGSPSDLAKYRDFPDLRKNKVELYRWLGRIFAQG